MKFIQENVERTCPESEIYNALLSLDGKRILELGCGTAMLTREIATEGQNRQIIATEVDEQQHEKNLAITDLPNVSFQLAGAESLPLENESQDIVFMFKSLHHVPEEKLEQAMQEINRVLIPGGMAYISEPVYADILDGIIRLFHDEGHVRKAAFQAMERAIANKLFTLKEEVFFNVPVDFVDFEDFENKVMGATHTDYHITEAIYEEVKNQFNQHMTDAGAHFTPPLRVDLLQKPS